MKESISAIVPPGMHSEEFVVMFLGFACADLPELHTLECPKMLESWERFKVTMGKRSAADGEVKP